MPRAAARGGRTRADRDKTGGYRYECIGCGWKGFGLSMKMRPQPRPLEAIAKQMVEQAQMSYKGDLEGQSDGLTDEAKQAVKEAREAQIRKG